MLDLMNNKVWINPYKSVNHLPENTHKIIQKIENILSFFFDSFVSFFFTSILYRIMSNSIEEPYHVLITGAAGQIGYVLAFRVANGDLFGDHPVVLHLLEVSPAMKVLEAVVMELNDCTFPNLYGVVASDDPSIAAKDVDIAFLVGSYPKKPSTKQEDYLLRNAVIYSEHGKALNKYAKKTVKVLVVGTPANTNALIAMNSAPSLKPEQFCAMTRLDHNRAVSAIARKLEVHSSKVFKVCVWGNRSSNQVPDVSNAEYVDETGRHHILDKISAEYVNSEFRASLSQRGSKVMKMRGASSAASAATAAIMHMKDWIFGTKNDDFVSMAIPVPESKPYGISPGIFFSFPCTVDKNGNVHVVENLNLDPVLSEKIKQQEEEIKRERDLTFEALRNE